MWRCSLGNLGSSVNKIICAIAQLLLGGWGEQGVCISNLCDSLVSEGFCNWFYTWMLQSLHWKHRRGGGVISPAPKGGAVPAANTLVLCVTTGCPSCFPLFLWLLIQVMWCGHYSEWESYSPSRSQMFEKCWGTNTGSLGRLFCQRQRSALECCSLQAVCPAYCIILGLLLTVCESTRQLEKIHKHWKENKYQFRRISGPTGSSASPWPHRRWNRWA